MLFKKYLLSALVVFLIGSNFVYAGEIVLKQIAIVEDRLSFQISDEEKKYKYNKEVRLEFPTRNVVFKDAHYLSRDDVLSFVLSYENINPASSSYMIQKYELFVDSGDMVIRELTRRTIYR